MGAMDCGLKLHNRRKVKGRLSEQVFRNRKIKVEVEKQKVV